MALMAEILFTRLCCHLAHLVPTQLQAFQPTPFCLEMLISNQHGANLLPLPFLSAIFGVFCFLVFIDPNLDTAFVYPCSAATGLPNAMYSAGMHASKALCVKGTCGAVYLPKCSATGWGLGGM